MVEIKNQAAAAVDDNCAPIAAISDQVSQTTKSYLSPRSLK